MNAKSENRIYAGTQRSAPSSGSCAKSAEPAAAPDKSGSGGAKQAPAGGAKIFYLWGKHGVRRIELFTGV